MNLFMLVGVPASGKSTFIQKAKDHHVKHGKPPFVILSTDNYIDEVAARRGTTYSEIFVDTIKDATKAMYEDLDYAVLHGLDIVWDQTNLTAKSRLQKMAQIPTTYHRHAIFFATPDHHEWQARLLGRPGKVIPENVLNNMKNTIEVPTFDEPYENIYLLNADGRTMRTLNRLELNTTPELMWVFMNM